MLSMENVDNSYWAVLIAEERSEELALSLVPKNIFVTALLLGVFNSLGKHWSVHHIRIVGST